MSKLFRGILNSDNATLWESDESLGDLLAKEGGVNGNIFACPLRVIEILLSILGNGLGIYISKRGFEWCVYYLVVAVRQQVKLVHFLMAMPNGV